MKAPREVVNSGGRGRSNTKIRTCAEVVHFRDLKEVRKSWSVVCKLGNHKREGVIQLFRGDIMSQVHWGVVCRKY